MTEVTPAVLAESYTELKGKLGQYVNIAKMVQIDVCDGKFVPSLSWPLGRDNEESVRAILEEEEGMPFWESIDFEFDLMVINAHKHFDMYAKLGAKRIIFHIEAETKESFKEFLETLDPYFKDNIEIGIAINTTTPITELDPFINLVDFVQCMGIEKIGFQGEPFDERVIEQIKSLKGKYPEVKISVDGCVNENTAPLLVEAGADRLVIGSVLLQSYDKKETIKQFEAL